MAIIDRLNNFCHPVSNFWVSFSYKSINPPSSTICEWGWGWHGTIVYKYLFYAYAYVQWEDGTSACNFYYTRSEATVPIGANTSCHDEVDFSLCFEDTAILYGICTVFWVLAGLSFFRGNPGLRPPLTFRPLYASKLVCPLACYN